MRSRGRRSRAPNEGRNDDSVRRRQRDAHVQPRVWRGEAVPVGVRKHEGYVRTVAQFLAGHLHRLEMDGKLVPDDDGQPPPRLPEDRATFVAHGYLLFHRRCLLLRLRATVRWVQPQRQAWAARTTAPPPRATAGPLPPPAQRRQRPRHRRTKTWTRTTRTTTRRGCARGSRRPSR
jgi:hypothetical protein